MYVNLSHRVRNRYIYRIVTVERLKEFLSSGRNTLVKPKSWDDPFENFILKSKVRHKSGEIREYNYHERIYGQCWTLQKASDAMWRIYAPDKKGIRIRTRISDLFDSLRKELPGSFEGQWCIGRVRYLAQAKMRRVADRTFDDSGISTVKLLESLLVKRPAFKHEREVRLLYFEIDDTLATRDVCSYEVDSHTLISQIMVDPRLTAREAAELKEEIRDTTGFNGEIKRSLLYTPPRGNVVNVTDDLLP